MSPQDLWSFGEQMQGLMDSIMGTAGPALIQAGLQLWEGLALILIVWTGAQIALAGHGMQLERIVTLAIQLSIPRGMLLFYTTSLPGTTLSVPMAITGMGEWIRGLLVDSTASQIRDRFRTSALVLWARITTPAETGPPTVTAADLDAPWADTGMLSGWLAGVLDAFFDFTVTALMNVTMWLFLLVVWALGMAQVIWGQLALNVAILLGPIFIPWLIFAPLSFLFWGWMRTMLHYSLYGAVAGALFNVVGGMLLWYLDGFTTATFDLRSVGEMLNRVVLILPFSIAAILATLKVGELTQLLISGSGNAGSGFGSAVRQAARVKTMGIGG